MSPKAERPVTIRAFRLTTQQFIPIAQALGWPEPDPYNNKTIVAFMRRLWDHCYMLFVEKQPSRDEQMEDCIVALRLVRAYTEGLGEVPPSLKPAVELAEKFSQS